MTRFAGKTVPWWGQDLSYMPALDGVRAFAVLGTMAYHGGVLVPNSGFFGLDTFFALSGYLITTLLLTEWTRSSTIRLRAFWVRRAKRLLPALFLVLIAVALYGAWLVPPGTYPDLRSDVISALFYFANWHFIATGSDYFANSGSVSPVLHTWSLAIEEQFYLIWPLLVLGLLKLWRSKRVLLAVCVLGALASAAVMAVLYTPTDINRLYYGTDTRAQSLLVGAALAVALSLWKDKRLRQLGGAPVQDGPAAVVVPPASQAARVPLLLVGIAGVLGTAVLWTRLSESSVLVYRGGFFLAATATAAVLLSVTCYPSSPLARILSVAPLRYVGRVSYGMYLWHFPLFQYINDTRTGLTQYSLFAVRFAATLIVATLSFYLVEQPVRRTRNIFDWRLLTGLPVGAATTAAAVIAVTTFPRIETSSATGANPSPSAALVSGAPNPHDLKVLLVGDSMAQTLGNGVEGMVHLFFGWQQQRGIGIADLGPYYSLQISNQATVNCGLVPGIYRLKNSAPLTPSKPCDPQNWQAGWPAAWAQLVAADKPKVTIFLGRLDILNHVFNGQWTHIGDPAYDSVLWSELQEAVRILTAHGGKVVLMTSPYYSTGEKPNGEPWAEDDPSRVDRYNAMLEQLAQEYPRKVYVFDLNRVIDPGGKFQSTIDGVTVRYADGVHLTPAGDCWLAPRVLPYIYAVASSQVPPPQPATPAEVATAAARIPSSVCTSG